MELVAATGMGFVRIASDGTPTHYEVDTSGLELPSMEDYDGMESQVGDAVCTTSGDVIVLLSIQATTLPSGNCETGG
jgi:hypothetical protein